MNRNYTKTHHLMSVRDLHLEFNGHKILRDINLTIKDIVRPDMQQGQVISILGPSGIGKTQLFKCIAGLMKPTSGAILVSEKERPVIAGEVGFVFQHYPLLQHRTVMHNLLLAANNAGKTKQEVIDLLNDFSLLDKATAYPAQLSGGQKQRISIMQQLLCSDHFVLMDEPFSGLDIISKQKMMDLILKISVLHEENTLILTTHDIDTAVSISDTLIVVGNQRDEKGVTIPGATIVKEVDLIERGLAWNPDVRKHPNFRSTCEEMYLLFKNL
jgi:ABC-type nitrate/sulfonate/bicarbonate transport system ATPase subunit